MSRGHRRLLFKIPYSGARTLGLFTIRTAGVGPPQRIKFRIVGFVHSGGCLKEQNAVDDPTSFSIEWSTNMFYEAAAIEFVAGRVSNGFLLFGVAVGRVTAEPSGKKLLDQPRTTSPRRRFRNHVHRPLSRPRSPSAFTGVSTYVHRVYRQVVMVLSSSYGHTIIKRLIIYRRT